jgi:hypothetical protein
LIPVEPFAKLFEGSIPLVGCFEIVHVMRIKEHGGRKKDEDVIAILACRPDRFKHFSGSAITRQKDHPRGPAHTATSELCPLEEWLL